MCWSCDRGYASESEGEEVGGQEVTLPQDLPGRGNTQSTQSTIKLTEVVSLAFTAFRQTIARCTSFEISTWDVG